MLRESAFKELLKRLPVINKKFVSWGSEYKASHDIQERFLMLWTHAPLIEAVIALQPKEILEIGAGEGLISTALSWLGYQVSVIDNDRQVIEESQRFINSLGGKQTVLWGDALERNSIPQTDVIVSHGLLEHFTDQEIAAMLDNMLARSRKGVVFCVPSIWYFPWWSNARHMSLRQWRRILSSYSIKLSYYGAPKPKSVIQKLMSIFGYRNIFILGVIRKNDPTITSP